MQISQKIEKKSILISKVFSVFPERLQNRILQSPAIQKTASSIGWLFFDKIIRMGIGLFVGVWVARYLGPEKYGMINYATAFIALFSAVASFGIDNIVTRDLVRNPDKAPILLGSSFVLKLLGGVGVIVLAGSAILFARPKEPLIFCLVLITSAGTVFQAFDTIDFYFQAKVLSKYTVIAKDLAFVIASLIKVYLLLSKASLISFAAIGLFEIILGASFMMFLYHYNDKNVFQWKPSYRSMKELLLESWPLLLSGLAIMLYMRIDQVMLGKMIGDASVGMYSAAIRISEMWYFIPASISISIFPALIKAKEQGEEIYKRRLHQIFKWMFWISVPIASLIALSSKYIVDLLYGAQYKEAGEILAVHIWAGVPLFIGLGYGKMFVIEGFLKASFNLTFINVILNIGLNLLLIPKYHGTGAALATTITQFFSFFLGTTYLNLKCGIFHPRKSIL